MMMAGPALSAASLGASTKTPTPTMAPTPMAVSCHTPMVRLKSVARPASDCSCSTDLCRVSFANKPMLYPLSLDNKGSKD